MWYESSATYIARILKRVHESGSLAEIFNIFYEIKAGARIDRNELFYLSMMYFIKFIGSSV